MSGARETIFAALEAAHPGPAPAPVRVVAPAMPADPEAVLASRVTQAGGGFVRARRADWVGAVDWPMSLDSVAHMYVGPEVGVPDDPTGGLTSRGAGATAVRTHDLAPLEFCVLRAAFVVVENGAAWHVPASALERGAALLAEHLVVVVDSTSLVATLHQAYDRIATASARFGWFLCGPSKTADIEQALVLGAHGPRTMQLVLLDA